MSSSSSIPFEIRRTTDSFNNGKLKERQISIDITPKKNSNPSSPSFVERNIVIDIQKRTEFVNVQTNTPHFEQAAPVYRASPFRKDRLNYSEYTNPGRSLNSSNYFNGSTTSNLNNSTNNRSHKNRSVISSSTIAELSENNYHTFDPITPKSSDSRRRQNQIPQTDPRPKLRAFHHFTPPRYEPRPPTNGKAYLSQLSEDSGSSVCIDSSMELLSEKDNEQGNEEKYEYDTSDEILPIKRGPRYHFIMSSSDLTTFSDEQNSSSSSKRKSKNKSKDANSASNYYSNYSYTNYSNTEENPEEDNNSYASGHRSHKSHHTRHSYSHASHRSKHQSENSKSRRSQINDDQSPREEKEYSDRNAMQTPVQPRYTIYGKRSPPKTQPVNKSVKSRNVDLDDSNSESINQKQQAKHSNTQRAVPSENHKHHSHTKSNASSSQMSKSVHSHAHSRTSRKSEPYYVRMKFTNSEELTEFDKEDVQYASFHKFTTREPTVFTFQDTTNYYASLDTVNTEISSKTEQRPRDDQIPQKTRDDQNPLIIEEEEESPEFDFNDHKKEEEEEEELKETQTKTSSKPEEETKENNIEKPTPKVENEDHMNDEDFQKLVEVPIRERKIDIDDSTNNKSKKNENYQQTQEGLINKVESQFNNEPAPQNSINDSSIQGSLDSKSNKQDDKKNKSSGEYQEMQRGLIEKVENSIDVKEKEVKIDGNENPTKPEEDQLKTEQDSKSEEEQHSKSEEEQHSKSEEEQHSRSEEEQHSGSEILSGPDGEQNKADNNQSKNSEEDDEEIEALLGDLDKDSQKTTSAGSKLSDDNDDA